MLKRLKGGWGGNMEPKVTDIAAEVAQVLIENQPALLRTARRVLRDDVEAQDVVSEVVLSVYAAPGVLDGVENIAGWLLTMAYRRSIDALRRLRRRRVADGVDHESIESGVSESPADPETVAAVREIVRQLPSDLKFAFEANTVDEKTFREMSAESGIPMGTLMARKKRAVELIREGLKLRGFLPTAV